MERRGTCLGYCETRTRRPTQRLASGDGLLLVLRQSLLQRLDASLVALDDDLHLADVVQDALQIDALTQQTTRRVRIADDTTHSTRHALAASDRHDAFLVNCLTSPRSASRVSYTI